MFTEESHTFGPGKGAEAKLQELWSKHPLDVLVVASAEQPSKPNYVRYFGAGFLLAASVIMVAYFGSRDSGNTDPVLNSCAAMEKQELKDGYSQAEAYTDYVDCMYGLDPSPAPPTTGPPATILD